MKPSSICPIVPPLSHFTSIDGVADDGADLQPVAQRDAAVGHAVHAVVALHHAVVLGVGLQARAAARRRSPAPTGTRRASARGSCRRCAPRRTARRQRSRRRAPCVTRCCTSTSSGLSGATRFSMRPAATARRAATASTSSSVLVGTSVTRLTRPGWWPQRPARCSSRATPLAEPICSTRSTGRKSTPEVERRGGHHRLQRCRPSGPARPIRAPPCRASRGAARSGRPIRAARAAAAGTRSRPASARW